LLKAADDSGFDVLVTGDLSIERQQNLKGRKLAIVSLSAHNWRILKSHVAKIAAAVDAAGPGSFVRVECGTFSRRGAKPEGPEVIIKDGSLTVAVLHTPAPPRPSIEECNALLPEDSSATIDEDFARGVAEAVANQREPLNPPAWD
jgi:hypothetical protein